MSKDIIYREDAIKAIDAYDDTAYALQDVQRITDGIAKVVNAIPSADRPQGEWIDAKNAGWKCTVCGKWSNGQYDYCPHCGARMKGVDDELV